MTKERDHIRLQRSMADFSHVRVDQSVQIYTGTGWSQGTLVGRRKDHVYVALKSQKRTIAVWDARNIR